jgi:hypothetical protein
MIKDDQGDSLADAVLDEQGQLNVFWGCSSHSVMFFVRMAVSDVLGEILLTRSHKLGESLKKKKTEQGRWCLWGQKSCLLVCLFACLLVGLDCLALELEKVWEVL